MEEAAINDLHDIARFAPNSFAAAGFGNPSLPTIRGQLGELFEAGMRRQAGNNGLGIPMSFNAIEGIAVVKGRHRLCWAPHNAWAVLSICSPKPLV